MAETFIQQLIQNQQLISKSRIEDSIKNANNRILSFSRSEIGLIDLDAEILKGTLTPIVSKDSKYNVKAFLDNSTGLIYRFKYNDNSGGILLGRKELYETLISRMVKKFADSVIYYPAEIDGERGVLSLDWNNGFQARKILGKEIDAESLAEINYYLDSCRSFSAKALKDFKKIPQHFMAGNCDFASRNVNYAPNGEKIGSLMFFDYGYSTFARVESYLTKMSLAANKQNIKMAYEDGIWGAINCTVGMGATKNLMQYDGLYDLMEDFVGYSARNEEFKANVKKSLQLNDTQFVEEITRLREEGFKFYKDNEKIVRQITEANSKIYEKCL